MPLAADDLVTTPAAQYGVLGLLGVGFLVALRLLYGRGASYDRLEAAWRGVAERVAEDTRAELARLRAEHAVDIERIEHRCARELSEARSETAEARGEAHTARQEAEEARREAAATRAELHEVLRRGGVDLRRYRPRSEQRPDPGGA